MEYRDYLKLQTTTFPKQVFNLLAAILATIPKSILDILLFDQKKSILIFQGKLVDIEPFLLAFLSFVNNQRLDMTVNQGTIISIRGSIIDVLFSNLLPEPRSLLKAGEDRQIALEVMTYLGSVIVRTIALNPTQGLSRGSIQRSNYPLWHWRAISGRRGIISRDERGRGVRQHRDGILADERISWGALSRRTRSLNDGRVFPRRSAQRRIANHR